MFLQEMSVSVQEGVLEYECRHGGNGLMNVACVWGSADLEGPPNATEEQLSKIMVKVSHGDIPIAGGATNGRGRGGSSEFTG